MVYALLYHITGIHERTVFFESYHGRRMGDSPYAIFLRMMEQPQFQNYRFIWVLDDTGNPLARQFANRKNVKYVRRHSLRYLYYLCRSKYLFNNNTFPHYFQKKQGQIYVNTWHGTPLKTLGKDIRGTPGQHRNMARNFLLSDYFVNPNPFTADVLIRANDLGRLYKGLVVLEGYPRNDLLINADPNKFRQFLFEHCQVPLGPKIILYAPTWRGEIGKPEDTSEEIYRHIKAMRRLVPEGYILLLKVHGLTYRYVKEDSTLHEVICVPDWVETNELLSVVDVLVTDYSSIFFDFLCTGRPIVFSAMTGKCTIKTEGCICGWMTCPAPWWKVPKRSCNAFGTLTGSGISTKRGWSNSGKLTADKMTATLRNGFCKSFLAVGKAKIPIACLIRRPRKCCCMAEG